MNERSLGPALIGLAGILALLSYFLHWAKFTIGTELTSPVSGYVGYQRVGLSFGLILLISAVLSRQVKTWIARAGAGLAVVCGAVIGGYATYELTTEKSRSLSHLAGSLAGVLGIPLDQARAVVNAEAAKGLDKVAFPVGLWLAFAAAALAIAGGLITFRTRVEPADLSAPVRLDAELGDAPRTTGLREVEGPADGESERDVVGESGEGDAST
jgi:hypothetical protein